MNDLTKIIKRPLITEKFTGLKETLNRYAFEVDKKANKHDIKRAVEAAFKVKVTDVATMNVYGKIKRQGRSQGKRPDWKKAVVTLAKDQKIELAEGV
jgi:large subunit ribosomal protein L23